MIAFPREGAVRLRHLGTIAWVSVAACAEPPASSPPVVDDPRVELTPVEHLNRASMVLRGVRPSVAELELVRDDAGALPGLVDAYLYDPRFGDTVRDLHNDAWSMRATGQINVTATGSLAEVEMTRLRVSLYESPLRTIQHVVENDLPYTEILAADYQLGDEVVSRAFSHLDGYDDAAGGWQVLRWTDDRPAAGILSDSMMYVRFASMGANYNRGRANHVSRALLCHDYLDREITLDGSIDLSDPAVVADAVTESEACATCHRTLDPLASFFSWRGGFNLRGQVWPTELYMPQWTEDELWWETTGQAPAYYGAPGRDMGDLARFIREDDRFSLCTAKRFYGWMTETPLSHVPPAAATELQDVLVASGWNARALARAVVLHPDFRVAATEDPEAADDVIGLQRARPEQLRRMFEDLTGFVWQTYVEEECCLGDGVSPIGLVDVTTDAWTGFQTLLGGIDGAFVSQPVYTANATTTLALRELAAEAAGWVVPRDFDQPDRAQRKLLTLVERDTTDRDAIVAQLVALHTRIYAEFVGPDDPSVVAAWELWADVHARSGDPERAWQATLTGMLQDWRILYY